MNKPFAMWFARLLALPSACGLVGLIQAEQKAAGTGEPAAKGLQIYFVDVGRSVGNATVLVAPPGETMLLDAGPSFSVTRLLDVLKKAGVKQVAYLVNTHYHADHFAATVELAKQVPVIHYVDHGESVELGTGFTKRYEAHKSR